MEVAEELPSLIFLTFFQAISRSRPSDAVSGEKQYELKLVGLAMPRIHQGREKHFSSAAVPALTKSFWRIVTSSMINMFHIIE